MDYWRLCDELSVVQAALLIVGQDPAGNQEYILTWKPDDRPSGFDAAFAALKNAINSERLVATVRRRSWERGWNEDPGEGQDLARDERGVQIIYEAEPDWNQTTVNLEDLRTWLAKRGLRTGFFFPTAAEGPDYLDPKHPRYAPKMAAAVLAWLNVTDPGGKHPKQALAKWLREHAAEFALTDEDGKPNETGIEESAKVANWQPGGGAPRTPGTNPTTP